MNPPQVYMCSPSWTLFPPHTIPLGRPSAPAPSIQYRGIKSENLISCSYCSVTQSCPTLCECSSQVPFPSSTPRACSNSCPLSWWCHPTISSSVVSFSSCLQSSPASGSFHMSRFFTSGGQSIGASASASVLPVNIQDWFPLGQVWSPCSPRDSQESSPTP